MTVRADPLAGLRLLITGAGSGIGLAAAMAACERDARVVGTAYDEPQRAALAKVVGGANVCITDLADPSAAAGLVNVAAGRLGGLDGALLAAAIYDGKPTMESELTGWRRILAVNLDANFLVATAAARALGAGGGAIVLVSSGIARAGHRKAGAYAASKAGLEGMTRALALELAERNVRVNALAPGPTQTPMTAGMDPARRGYLEEAIPMRRFGTAAEVAAAALFLLSRDASYITGQVLGVNGGFTLT